MAGIQATVQEILNQAAGELGIQIGQVGALSAGVHSSQAVALLNALGEDLLRIHDWQFLEGTASYTGVNVVPQGDYSECALPADFYRIVNQTEWAEKIKRPMYGPMSAQMWGWALYGIVATGVFYRYRILDDKFLIFPQMTDPAEVFNFFYIKKNWLKVDAGALDYTLDTINAGANVPIFSRRLLVAGMKLRLWNQKGFDTTSLQKEFDYVLAAEKGQNQGAPVIDMSGPSDRFYIDPLINTPDGSWNV